MIGKRIHPSPDDKNWLPEHGEYGLHPATGAWYATTPNGHAADLRSHAVTEHEDGTITVSPSILISVRFRHDRPKKELWHGFLERGVWREC